ncbi:hypothetical protein CHU98_g10663, partial [Xylaria longipes]
QGFQGRSSIYYLQCTVSIIFSSHYGGTQEEALQAVFDEFDSDDEEEHVNSDDEAIGIENPFDPHVRASLAPAYGCDEVESTRVSSTPDKYLLTYLAIRAHLATWAEPPTTYYLSALNSTRLCPVISHSSDHRHGHGHGRGEVSAAAKEGGNDEVERDAEIEGITSHTTQTGQVKDPTQQS